MRALEVATSTLVDFPTTHDVRLMILEGANQLSVQFLEMRGLPLARPEILRGGAARVVYTLLAYFLRCLCTLTGNRRAPVPGHF